MGDFEEFVERIRQRRWLVLGVGVAFMLIAIVVAVSAGSPWTARSTVVVGASSGASRTPEQHSVVARGYVELLNNPQYQDRLRAAGEVDSDVTLKATTVADSPFIEIAATAPSAEGAVQGVSSFTKAFVGDTVNSFNTILEAQLRPLRAQLRETATNISEAESRLANSSLSASAAAELRGELAQLRTERAVLATQLEEVTSTAGNPNLVGGFGGASDATQKSSSLLLNGILGLVGGLIVGAVIAIVLGALRRRLTTPADVSARLGLPTLAAITGTDPRRRQEGLQSLANATVLAEPGLAALAVTSANAREGKTFVASNLARHRAALGDRVILIDANLRGEPHGAGSRRPGLSKLLRSNGDIHDALVDADVDGLRILPSGSAGVDDPYPLFTGDRLAQVLDQARAVADLIVIDTPALLGAAESQAICSVADRTILVVNSVDTPPAAATAARDTLARVHAAVLGVVLTRNVGREAVRTSTQTGNRHRSKVRPEAARPKTK